MSAAPEFALVPLARLRGHERIDPAKVDELAHELRTRGIFADPIWVTRDSDVILNGHHRVAALRRLGAIRVPAWIVTYDDPTVRLDRWTPGPPITKEEVVRRARSGDLFPPKTTRHRLTPELPARPTPVSELMPARAAAHPRALDPPRPPGAGASGPG